MEGRHLGEALPPLVDRLVASYFADQRTQHIDKEYFPWQTVIGDGAVVGGSVFLTESVAPGHQVTIAAPVLKVRPPAPRPRSDQTSAGGLHARLRHLTREAN